MTEEDEKVFDVVYIKRIVVSVTAKKQFIKWNGFKVELYFISNIFTFVLHQ